MGRSGSLDQGQPLPGNNAIETYRHAFARCASSTQARLRSSVALRQVAAKVAGGDVSGNVENLGMNFVDNRIASHGRPGRHSVLITCIEQSFYLEMAMVDELTARLHVSVALGFAETEYYVMVPGGPAAYVDRGLVNVDRQPSGDDQVAGDVRVYVIEQTDRDALIELPGEPVIGGLRARVDQSLLTQ